MSNKVDIANQTETIRRAREIQILINIIEPDPEYQPFLLTDEASAYDISMASAQTITERLELYLDLSLPVPLTTPLWELVDAIKIASPNWPDN